jgi:hypothetical protein
MTTMANLDTITYRRLGVLLMVLGGLFALGTHFGVTDVFKLWPVLVVTTGIGFVGIFAKRRAKGAFYLAFGEYLILFGGLALYCNYTSWAELKTLWPLFVGFLGVVFATLLVFRPKNRLLLFFALLFFLLAAGFFVVFSLGSQYWWSILVLVGLSVLVAGRES